MNITTFYCIVGIIAVHLFLFGLSVFIVWFATGLPFFACLWVASGCSLCGYASCWILERGMA